MSIYHAHIKSHRAMASALRRQAERCRDGSAAAIGFDMMATAHDEVVAVLEAEERKL